MEPPLHLQVEAVEPQVYVSEDDVVGSKARSRQEAVARHHFSCHVQWLLQEFAFIRDLAPIVQGQIADVVAHASRKEGDVLFRQGDPPDDCYIILVGEMYAWQKRDPHLEKVVEVPPLLEGSANVRRHAEVILNILKEEEKGSLRVNHLVQPSQQRRASFLGRTPSKRRLSKNCGQGTDYTSEWMQVATLGPGMVVGEVGLLEDQPRNATLQCHSDVEFLVIKKQDFNRVLKGAMNRLRFQQLHAPMRMFLKEFDFFKNLKSDVQRRMPEFVHYVHYEKDAVVFREGDKPQSFFIILTGEVMKWRKNASNSGPASLAADANKIIKMKCAAMLARLRENEEYTRNTEWVERDELLDYKSFGAPVIRFGCGYTFGFEGIVDDHLRGATITCSQACDCLRIDKVDYESLLKEKMRLAHLALPSLILPLMPELPYFNTMSKSLQEHLAYAMHLSTKPKGKVVLKEGDAPSGCYLILSGKIGVWKQVGGTTDHSHTEPPPAAETCKLRHSETWVQGGKLDFVTGSQAMRDHCCRVAQALDAIEDSDTISDLAKVAPKGTPMKEEERQQEETSEVEHLTSSALGMQVGLLGRGAMVGMESLVDSVPESVSISCIEQCTFLVLSTVDFNRVRKDMLREKVMSLSSVVRRLLLEFDIFKDLEPSVQERMANVAEYACMRPGQLVFNEGDSPDFCYIILKGEVTVWMAQTSKRQAAIRRAEQELTKSFTKCKTSASLWTVATQDDDEEEEPAKPEDETRPPLALASTLAREKCGGLAAMLGEYAKEEFSKLSCSFIDDSLVKASCTAVASLGPGSLFGELALINSNPRNATISCYTACEFLRIAKADFDGVVKAEMKRAKEKTFQFLRNVVPGMRHLPQDIVDRVSYYFTREKVPRNHTFVEQGEECDGSFYFIWQGSVESYHYDASSGFRRRGIMLQGSIFAAVPPGAPAPFSVVATSSTCEVLHVKPENRKHLPDSVIRKLREVLDQTLSRRSSQCLPLSPMGSVLESAPVGATTNAVVRTRNGKVPRPLSGKFPPIQVRGRPQYCAQAISPSKTFSLPSFKGLFEKERTTVEHKEFELQPGETIASLAQRPKKRERRTMVESVSLPALK